jgi:hypothetical protein
VEEDIMSSWETSWEASLDTAVMRRRFDEDGEEIFDVDDLDLDDEDEELDGDDAEDDEDDDEDDLDDDFDEDFSFEDDEEE